jgi:hypothetical protein
MRIDAVLTQCNKMSRDDMHYWNGYQGCVALERRKDMSSASLDLVRVEADLISRSMVNRT